MRQLLDTMDRANKIGEVGDRLSQFWPKYTTYGYLGSGVYGFVYAVHDTEDGQKYAMKVIQSKNLVPDIVREIAAYKKLQTCNQHRNIVRFMGCDFRDNLTMLKLELCDGFTLEKYIHSKTWLTKRPNLCEKIYKNIKSIVDQLIDVVDYLHYCQIAHRDLKPGNIYIVDDDTCTVKLFDFGLAYVEPTMNGPEKVVTTWWRAPELLCTNDSCCHLKPNYFKTDLWSLGVIIVESYNVRGCLYAGCNEENEMMEKTIELFGVPSNTILRQCFISHVGEEYKQFKQNTPVNVGQFTEVVAKLLKYNPDERKLPCSRKGFYYNVSRPRSMFIEKLYESCPNEPLCNIRMLTDTYWNCECYDYITNFETLKVAMENDFFDSWFRSQHRPRVKKRCYCF